MCQIHVIFWNSMTKVRHHLTIVCSSSRLRLTSTEHYAQTKCYAAGNAWCRHIIVCRSREIRAFHSQQWERDVLKLSLIRAVHGQRQLFDVHRPQLMCAWLCWCCMSLVDVTCKMCTFTHAGLGWWRMLLVDIPFLRYAQSTPICVQTLLKLHAIG